MKHRIRQWNKWFWLLLGILLTGCGSGIEPLLPYMAAQCTVAESLPPDDQAPSIVGVTDLQMYLGHELDYLKGVSVTDNMDTAPDITVDDSQVDLQRVGVYTISYIARDVSGNQTTQTATLTILIDTQPPQILGVNPLSVYQDSVVSYRSGILVEDDQTAAPILTIDSSQVDLSQPGTYPVIYRASDDAGNETVLETTITVYEKKNSYVEPEVVYDEADKLLKRIIREDMTIREQVEAIYKWFQKNCYYISTSDKSDRLQAAYKILTGKRGDCYNYYAACSLLLERLEIPQISVERDPNAERDSRHYWSMVSLDGGETYYHLDVSPHVYFDMETCLVTDEVLARCNLYAPGYYDMEEGKYPKTPEE